MPSTVISPGNKFPVGTSVGAYPQSLVDERKRAGAAPQDQSAVESATVASDSTITFSSLVAGTRYSAYAPVPTASVTTPVVEAVKGASGINEIQTVTLVNVTGGTFTLTFDDTGSNPQTTAAIAYDASASAVQAALVALSNIGASDVKVYGTAPAWTVEFTGAFKETDVAALIVVSTLLTGPVRQTYVDFIAA